METHLTVDCGTFCNKNTRQEKILQFFFLIFATGIYIIPTGKSGYFSFEMSYPKLPEGHYVVYIGSAKTLNESKGAKYYNNGEREGYGIHDVYMRSGMH